MDYKNKYFKYKTKYLQLKQIKGGAKALKDPSIRYKVVPKGTNISFVVKYSMDGQKHLRPHHDASSYTINVALNDQSEYTGGGTHFIVNDYKKIGAPIGTMLIHPGRCTHYHSGLPITSGERYILVGFIE